ncbi:phage tailspike protein [Pluralibacter gergoviae]|uniref:phage tailspike protein n=1 Tax=Pluralibacter gergoviae TaxID=61647 RepID=UPI000650F185|nr:phage tailspike protein [Pluralibacter gergoviae]
MADTNYLVSNPNNPFTTPRSFKSIANGKIYIGQVDTDPANPVNQIPVYLVNEDGSEVQIAQPIIINSGGFPVYNGQIAKFITKQNYSMAVYDASGAQQYYWPDLSRVDPDALANEISALRKDLGSGENGLGDNLLAVRQPFANAPRTQHNYNLERFSFFDIPEAGFDLFNPFTDFDDVARAAAVANRSVYYGVNQLVAPRMGVKSWKYIDGTHDRSCIMSIRNTMSPSDMSEPSTQSFGAATLATLSRYANRDGVGIYCHIVAPPELFKSTATTFTATTVTCPELTTDIISQLKHRMVIDINTTDGKWWTSFLMGIDAVTKTLTVDTGWALMGSAGATLGTPASGSTIRIVGLTKVWAQNSLLTVNEDSRATAMAGFELGLYNNKSAISGVGYGFDSYSGGTYSIENAFQARGLYYSGFNSKSSDATRAFASTGSVPHGFYSNGDTRGLSVHNNLYGVVINSPTSYALQVQLNNNFNTGMDLNGKWQRLKGFLTTIPRGSSISYYATSVLISGGASDTESVTMPSNEHSLMIFIRNLSPTYAVVLNGKFEGNTTSYTLAAKKGALFQGDGTYWYPMQ